MPSNTRQMSLLSILLCGCAAGSGAPPIEPVRNIAQVQDAVNPHGFVTRPTVERFSICHGHTCRYIAETGLDEDEWLEIRSILKPAAETAAEERERIARAVARFEAVVGAKTGTDANLGGNFAGLGRPGQMDCIDEATNTTVYLTLLQNNGLLHWHRVAPRTNRGFVYFNFPHNTAVIREVESGARYAVDSWFLDSGKPPYIVPLSQWRRGWRPEWNED